MTKNELLARWADENPSITKNQLGAALSSLGGVITAELLGGCEVSLPGMGKFKLVQRAPRKGRNPRTGEALDIPARRALVFAASRELKSALS